MIDLKNMEPFVELPEALSHAETQTLKAMEDLGGKFKPSASTDNFYPPSENDEWTNGMWTGEINVMYELTGKDIFRKKALEHVDSFYDRIVSMSSINNHDMGFLYSPSCVAAYLLYGSDKGRDAAIMAADYLISRFQEKLLPLHPEVRFSGGHEKKLRFRMPVVKKGHLRPFLQLRFIKVHRKQEISVLCLFP